MVNRSVDYRMATENPKVSAYVPQAIKDRLIQFREERNISESQAVTSILAEYFGMTEVLGRSPDGTGGVTLAGMQAIEARLASFMEIVEGRLAKLENTTQAKSKLSVVQERLLENNQPASNLLSELPSEILLEAKPDEQEVSEVPLSLLGEPLEENTNQGQMPLALDLEEPDRELIKIDAELLARRLGMVVGSLRNKKTKLGDKEFIEWTTTKDSGGIGWTTGKEGRKIYYKPAVLLESEVLSSLLKWIKENS